MVKVEMCWVANWIVKGSANDKVGSTTVPLDTIGQSVQICFAIDHVSTSPHMLDNQYNLSAMWVSTKLLIMHRVIEIIPSVVTYWYILLLLIIINLSLKGNLLMII